MSTATVDEILEKHFYQEFELMDILRDIQESRGYLSEKNLILVANKLDLPQSRVRRVASYYKSFYRSPRGAHLLRVCTGATCHIQGGKRLLDHIRRRLDIEPGETTNDLTYTLETAHCLGCCSLAPAFMIGEEAYCGENLTKVSAILDSWRTHEHG